MVQPSLREELIWIAGFAGSRSGALIATAWASMVHLGEEGYLQLTGDIMKVRALKPTLSRHPKQHTFS